MKRLLTLLLCVVAGAALGADRSDVRLYDEGSLGTDYMIAPGTQITSPGFPFAAKGRTDNVCVALAYRVQPDGSAQGFAVLNNWTSNSEAARRDAAYLDPYARAAAEAVSQWRFVPKHRDAGSSDTAVTIATFAFKGERGGEELGDIRAHCKIDKITAYESRLRHMGAFDRDMNKSNYLGNLEREWRENNRFVFDYPLDHFQR